MSRHLQQQPSLPTLFSTLLRNPHQSLNQAKQIHAQITTHSLLSPTLLTDLILLYTRRSDLALAVALFNRTPYRPLHSWNILISALASHSLHHDSLSLFLSLTRSGHVPDCFSLPPALKACGGERNARVGRTIHGLAVKIGVVDNVVVGGSVLDMYCKCGRLEDAFNLFEGMIVRDVVVWNAMIGGCAKAGLAEAVFDVVRRMGSDGVEVDLRGVPSVLTVCGRKCELRKGREVHGRMVRSLGVYSDVAVGNALIDMYGKCGCVVESRDVFDGMCVRNVVSWTALMSCYGVHGCGKECVCVFEEMRSEDVAPNCVTFTALLAGCSHSGLVDQGRVFFKSMVSDYKIFPEEEHYACMVDLLARSGNFEEALELVSKMPMEPSASIWGALLGACVAHKNVEVAEVAARVLFEIEGCNPSNYVALCSVYDACGMWDGVARIRKTMKEFGMVKIPGCSWISVEGRTHSFRQADFAHDLSGEIYCVLHGLLKTLMLFGDDIG